jgi:LCP family protein required for cell wall assembly
VNIKISVKIACTILGVLIIASAVLYFFAFTRYQEIKTDPIAVFNSDSSAAQTDESASNGMINVDGKQYKEKSGLLSLLFLGIDTTAQRIAHNKGYRSDMIMICALDIIKNEATLISIPRDTYAEVCKVDENTGKVTQKVMNKINAAFAFGHGKKKYSYANAIRAVEHLMNAGNGFNLDIRYYAGIDIDGIPRLATALGGVTVKLEEDFYNIGKAGQNIVLKGQKAVDFVTDRKNSGGDIQRIHRQQLFMLAIANRMQKIGATQSAPRLFEKISGFASTNLSVDEAVGLSIILDKMNIGSIRQVTIGGETAVRDYMSCYIADAESIKSIMLGIYYEMVQ